MLRYCPYSGEAWNISQINREMSWDLLLAVFAAACFKSLKACSQTSRTAPLAESWKKQARIKIQSWYWVSHRRIAVMLNSCKSMKKTVTNKMSAYWKIRAARQSGEQADQCATFYAIQQIKAPQGLPCMHLSTSFQLGTEVQLLGCAVLRLIFQLNVPTDRLSQT